MHSIIFTEFVNKHVVSISFTDQDIEFPQFKFAMFVQEDPKEGRGDKIRTGFRVREWSDIRAYEVQQEGGDDMCLEKVSWKK